MKVDFKVTVAYVGVCAFKLTGFKEIHNLSFAEPPGFFKQRDIIAMITYGDYHVEVRMPMDGRLQRINKELNPGFSCGRVALTGWNNNHFCGYAAVTDILIAKSRFYLKRCISNAFFHLYFIQKKSSCVCFFLSLEKSFIFRVKLFFSTKMYSSWKL